MVDAAVYYNRVLPYHNAVCLDLGGLGRLGGAVFTFGQDKKDLYPGHKRYLFFHFAVHPGSAYVEALGNDIYIAGFDLEGNIGVFNARVFPLISFF